VKFGILGSLHVQVHGRTVPVTAAKQRAVLTALLLRANETVSTPRLIDAVWGENPPRSARNLVQTYVWRIRSLLAVEAERLSVETCGYLLHVEPAQVDFLEFERLYETGRDALAEGRDAEAALALRAALELWRGEPAQDVVLHGDWGSALTRLAELRVAALEEQIEAGLRLSRHEDLIGDLRRLTAEHPLRERPVGQLMLALSRSGRQTEALDAFRTLRGTLVRELGIEPAAEVRKIHDEILRADGSAAGERGATRTRTGIVPRQLPAAFPYFVGRRSELELLTDVERREPQCPGSGVVIVVAGTAGVGKTAFALRWCHQAADAFPDGQLYVNLRGFEPSGTALTAAQAIRGFLDAFAVPATLIPADLPGQAALYRSLMANKRVLILLDNARDTEQVQPLLPASRRSTVLVTSRNELTGLTAAHGAHLVRLDLLNVDESRELLERRLGVPPAASEQLAMLELIELSSRLPLALNIVAARAAAHPGLPLAALAARIKDTRRRLDYLRAGHHAANLRAAFLSSYAQLSATAARMFRLLGLHRGPDISATAAASLAGLDQYSALSTLDELTAAHLLCEPSPDRFAFHDLLRAYAAEQASSVDTEADRLAAVHLAMDHYLHTARCAARLLNPGSELFAYDEPQGAATLPELKDADQALAWYAADRHVLSAYIAQEVDLGCDTHAWQLVHSILPFMDRGGHWDDMAAAGEAALASARRTADPRAEACARRVLARACLRHKKLERAAEHLTASLEIFRALNHQVGEARVRHDLALVCEQLQLHQEALAHAQRTLELLQAQGDTSGAANALNTVGWFHSLLGDHRQALTYCRQALALQVELHNHNGQADTWDSLGHAHQHLAEYDQASDCYRRAVELYRQLGDRYYEAGSLVRLGDTHLTTADAGEAVRQWTQALAILDELEHPDADELRAKISRTAETSILMKRDVGVAAPPSNIQLPTAGTAHERHSAVRQHLRGVAAGIDPGV
jgi:DNA-binding SARP family transcriptional activator/Tfp pilus assembly protein PilF